jgi:hypothetical protein
MSNITDFLPPIYDLRGKVLDKEVEFFYLPQNIGKLLYGVSNYRKGSPLKDENIKQSFFGKITNTFTSYKYESEIVGTNGFGIFICKNQTDNLIRKDIVYFDEATDLFLVHCDNVVNFIYQGTDIRFAFVNKDTNKVLFQEVWSYNKKHSTDNCLVYNLTNCVEITWTAYLSAKMEKDLQEKGYISFATYNNRSEKFEEFVRLDALGITFLQGKGEPFTYHFDEIKQMYNKGGELVIEHINLKKQFLFFKSGNENRIPLSQITNRRFFFEALKRLSGYTLAE